MWLLLLAIGVFYCCLSLICRSHSFFFIFFFFYFYFFRSGSGHWVGCGSMTRLFYSCSSSAHLKLFRFALFLDASLSCCVCLSGEAIFSSGCSSIRSGVPTRSDETFGLFRRSVHHMLLCVNRKKDEKKETKITGKMRVLEGKRKGIPLPFLQDT